MGGSKCLYHAAHRIKPYVLTKVDQAIHAVQSYVTQLCNRAVLPALSLLTHITVPKEKMSAEASMRESAVDYFDNSDVRHSYDIHVWEVKDSREMGCRCMASGIQEFRKWQQQAATS